MADIQLAGSVSTTGTSILGHFAVNFAADADHTLSVAEYTNNFLALTGALTATRKLIGPLVTGQTFVVQNDTTGGQSVNVIAASGTGVLVPPGQTVTVVCDGTNYLGTPFPVTVPLGGTGAATLTAHGVLVGEGAGAVVATSPGTAGQVLTSNGAAADPSFQAVVFGTGSPATVDILANETILAEDTTGPVIGFSSLVTTTSIEGATPEPFPFTYSHPDNTLTDWTLTIEGRNTANNGDAYRANLFFTYQRFGGGAPALVAGPIQILNVRTNGAGSTYGPPTVTLGGNVISINAVGAAATNINWSLIGQIQVVS